MNERRVPAALRREVAERARGCCEYCRSQARLAVQPFSIEHIVPKARGGDTTRENVALSCQGCNNHKYDKIEARDPMSGDVVALYHPRRDRWEEHFAWSDDFAFIVGLTATGRATVRLHPFQGHWVRFGWVSANSRRRERPSADRRGISEFNAKTQGRKDAKRHRIICFSCCFAPLRLGAFALKFRISGVLGDVAPS